jgi:small-conductance mechanosensitive channel
MHYRCNRLLRWLLALQLCIGLAVAAELPANGDIQTTSIAQIQQASNTLDKVRQSLDDADTSETLQALSEKALQSKRDADNAVTALEPLLKQIDARIAQLGPVAEGSEESPN